MAAGKNKIKHDERRSDGFSQLLNRWNLFANNKVKMSSAQVLAAKVVIGKSIPDLKAIEHSGKADDAVQHSMTVEFVEGQK